jgi:pyridine nucleotide-disulfide oxidoreductase family protein
MQRAPHLVLIGGGHAHAQVLLDWRNWQAQHGSSHANTPAPQISLITPFELAPYSGMIPGWIAGHFDWEECCVNFAHLCKIAGARLHLGEVASLDAQQQRIRLQDGTEIDYDLLSINIGSTLKPESDGSLPLTPMRPLASLHENWQTLQQQIASLPAGSRWQMLMVGGGPAGIECILSAQYRLQQLAPQVQIEWSLITRGTQILPGMAASCIKRMLAVLRQRQIRLIHGFAASHVKDGHLHASDGSKIAANAVLWATGAQAHGWPAQSSLAVDAKGFVLIDAQLRSLSHPNVFAVGDCCSWGQDNNQQPGHKPLPGLPKAGVFAVRMGPVLSHNLQQVLRQAPHPGLQSYRPQRHYLVIIGTGDAQALANRGRFSWQAAWIWRWKNRIDRGFLARFKRPMPRR